ncbi:hypothetical protein VOLCADRAFT_95508 [Volvox carteri f. nagariensis]|uniref:Uncharacterized protein n=1 Tax=Volvox carteri f. nagariensis TaxID=3068 RepID=D8U7N3_VOLCA|nr:uncharacterized protein VOLCADRAFT_95508 [Volvox carteri f. nagariensis]EFJ44264.1 hypothetical protein VOLCADRAFT_95508 [Volvox carteri f. nagariensis]|eukprot:XP_002954623.1 hypothetical protein VOLCADRAFT_95508 [Volvox carteri f. nagariensis]
MLRIPKTLKPGCFRVSDIRRSIQRNRIRIYSAPVSHNTVRGGGGGGGGARKTVLGPRAHRDVPPPQGGAAGDVQQQQQEEEEVDRPGWNKMGFSPYRHPDSSSSQGP